jgi:hypothetical protein
VFFEDGFCNEADACGPPSPAGFSTPVSFSAFAAWRRPRAASSKGKSFVKYSLQTSFLNFRMR